MHCLFFVINCQFFYSYVFFVLFGFIQFTLFCYLLPLGFFVYFDVFVILLLFVFLFCFYFNLFCFFFSCCQIVLFLKLYLVRCHSSFQFWFVSLLLLFFFLLMFFQFFVLFILDADAILICNCMF